MFTVGDKGMIKAIEGEMYGKLNIPVMGEKGLLFMSKLRRMAKLRGEDNYEGLIESLYESVFYMDVNKVGKILEKTEVANG